MATVIRKALCSIVLIAASIANATEPYYTNLSEDVLSCTVAKSIKASLTKEGKSWAEKKREISKRLKSYSDIEKAYAPDGPGLQGFANGIFIDRSGYLVQDAFLDPSLRSSLPKENWLGAYNYAAAVARTRFRSLKEPYNFVDDPKVVQKLEVYLKSPERFSSPDFDIVYTGEEKTKLGLQDKTVSLGGGRTQTTVTTTTVPQFSKEVPKETRNQAYAHFQEVNTLASPLFIWLAAQPKESVGHAQVFQKALEIYGDPITALGVIAWIPGIECAMGDRRKVALASSRLKPILFRASDHAGSIFHFWGYVVRGLLGEPDGISMLRFRSKVFEGIIQKDGQDVTTDMFGLRVAEKVSKFLDGDDSVCSEETLNRFPAINDTLKKTVPLPATVNKPEHVDESKASGAR